MLILVINAGSSSLRLALYQQTAQGPVQQIAAHHDNMGDTGPALLTDFLAQTDLSAIGAVVHRVVHGGKRLTEPCLIDQTVEEEIERLVPLAPLHNPPALRWIRCARQVLGEQIPQVAVFDTAFYKSLPDVAVTYALPQELCRHHGIRRYGFHGIAHQAMYQRWRELGPAAGRHGRVLSLQLGSGCSITAIDHGEPVETSMGFSPLEGLVMATRSGDVDPAVIAYLQRQAGLTVEEIEQLLNQRSGLLGLSEESADMRHLLRSDKPAAQLAIDLYCYRIRKYIGAYLAVLGGADAILFGGGVGEHSADVRARILGRMEWLGMKLDRDRNHGAGTGETMISATDSHIEAWVIPVDEAAVMVRAATTVC